MKKELESLLGSLAFLVKALPAGRTCCRRLLVNGALESIHLIRVTKEIRPDILMWVVFLKKFNDLTIFQSLNWSLDETA